MTLKYLNNVIRQRQMIRVLAINRWILLRQYAKVNRYHRFTFFHAGRFVFDVIVDSDIANLREEARRGNFDSMVLLATYIQKGRYTKQNKDLALSIFNYVLARKDEISFNETYWNALGQKCHIHSDRGEEEIIDHLALDMVRHMVQAPPDQWDHIKLISAIERLYDRMPTGLPKAKK